MNSRVLRPQNSLLRMLGQIQLELRQRLERRGILAVSRDVFSRIPVKMLEISFILLSFTGPLNSYPSEAPLLGAALDARYPRPLGKAMKQAPTDFSSCLPHSLLYARQAQPGIWTPDHARHDSTKAYGQRQVSDTEASKEQARYALMPHLS